ncbi:hypothetical protein P4O66_020534 [Electrophorus voltai]|uniref:Uncharacterized protein n=1 Tax=Electrophorus voltai TaxID=2609070 RepID=A0AAD9E490_9TELE|nr:hypothetical protein P4O66_020534 [Electrophorus voltai]
MAGEEKGECESGRGGCGKDRALPPRYRNTDRRRMPGKGSKRRKRKKVIKCPSTTHAERPSIILASLHTPTTGEEATGGFWGGPEYGPGSDSAESNRPQPDYKDQYSEVDSAGSYDPYMDYCEGYADYGGNRECSDVSLRSDLRFDYVEDPSMEMDEVLYGDPSNVIDADSADSRSDEPPARKRPPKAPPRRCCSGASKPFRAAQREVTSFKEETPSNRAHSPGTHAPVPKPRRGKDEVSLVLTPKTGKVTGAPPEMGVRKSPPPKSARGDPPQAGGTPTQPTTRGQARAPAGFSGLFNSPLCNFVPITVSVFIPLCIIACTCLFVCPCVCCHLGLCPSPSVLLTLACVSSLGPPASPLGVGFRAIAR